MGGPSAAAVRAFASASQPQHGLLQRGICLLLELDRPFPELTEEKLTAQAERDYNWNLTVNVADDTFLLFGAAFLAY